MTHRSTRRGVLLAIGGTAALPLVAAASPSTVQAVCDGRADLEAEIDFLGSRLAELEAELERLPDVIADRQRRILESHAARSEPRFASDVRARAREVGLDARESVVVLDVEGRHDEGTATAWFVTDHLLLTNAHNVGREFETLYGVTVGQETFEAELVGHVESQWPDVALLRTDFAGTPLSVGDSASLSRDDPLVQVGHPGAQDFGFWVLTLGGFLARSSPNALSATIPGLTGSSGSPILDLSGDVVAMTYGGGAAEDTAADGATDDAVRVGLLAAEPSTSAVPIETAMERMGGWT